MEFGNIALLAMIVEISVFLVLVFLFELISKKIDEKSYRLLDPKEYFPQDEIHTLKQVFYLII